MSICHSVNDVDGTHEHRQHTHTHEGEEEKTHPSLGNLEIVLGNGFFLQITVEKVQRAHDRPPVQRDVTNGDPVFLATNKQQVSLTVDDDTTGLADDIDVR